MSNFEQRLWEDLAREHGEHLSSRVIAPRRRWWRHPWLARAVIPAVAVLAVIGVLVLGPGSGTSRAYTVTKNPDGTVTVTVNELVGIHEANAELENLGVAARIVAVHAVCASTDRAVALDPRLYLSIVSYVQHGLTINPRAIPRGDVLVLAAKPRGSGVALAVTLYAGTAPQCVPTDRAGQ